jgi:hypothetical protein
MSGSASAILVALVPLFSALLVPAQTKQPSRMALETHADVCMGLSPAECCAQSIEIALFHATGDQIPKAAKLPVRLSCADPTNVVPEGACRSIALARGFAAKDASELCAAATLTKRCNGNDDCKSCSQELAKLKFQNGERACLAATHVATATDGGSKTIVLHDDKPKPAVGEGGNTFEIRKKRTVVQ